MSVLFEEQAAVHLDTLGLTIANERLDAACQKAAAEKWSYSHFLGYLLSQEIEQRKVKTVELNLQFAKFPYPKSLKDFDFAAQPSLDARLIEELTTLRFLSEGRNLVLLGPPGVGKTHIAIALGRLTCEKGHRAYFISAMDLARRLSQALAENRLRRELMKLVHPKVLIHKYVDVILDEIGYVALDATQASLLFQVICQRYDKGQPIILTSNKAFSDWAEVFAGDAVMASAALDRLLHKATVLNIRGDSYRMKERRQAGGVETTSLKQQRKPNQTPSKTDQGGRIVA